MDNAKRLQLGQAREGGQGKGLVTRRVAGDDIDADKAVAAAQGFAGLKGMDLAKEVTTEEAYSWNQSTWSLTEGYGAAETAKFKVVAYDFGVKHNILRIYLR